MKKRGNRGSRFSISPSGGGRGMMLRQAQHPETQTFSRRSKDALMSGVSVQHKKDFVFLYFLFKKVIFVL